MTQYRVVFNSSTYKVQRKRWLGWWFVQAVDGEPECPWYHDLEFYSREKACDWITRQCAYEAGLKRVKDHGWQPVVCPPTKEQT